PSKMAKRFPGHLIWRCRAAAMPESPAPTMRTSICSMKIAKLTNSQFSKTDLSPDVQHRFAGSRYVDAKARGKISPAQSNGAARANRSRLLCRFTRDPFAGRYCLQKRV